MEIENEQLKTIVSEMRKEVESLRDRAIKQDSSAQTIYELRREVYKL